MALIDNFPDWVQTKSGFWRNTKTGESSIWHPLVVQIAEPLYQKSSKWCRKAADDRNKLLKDKKP